MSKNQYVAPKFPSQRTPAETQKGAVRKRDPKVAFKVTDPRLKAFPGVEIKPDVEIQPDTEGWWTRNQSAEFLGVSVTTIANYESSGKLHPRHDYRKDNHGFDRRVALYDPKQLAPLRRGVGPKPERIEDPGELAASSFELFDQGRSIREVVIALRKTPEQIQVLHESWLDTGGSELIITPLAKAGLEKLVGPFLSVVDLLTLVEALAKGKLAPET